MIISDLVSFSGFNCIRQSRSEPYQLIIVSGIDFYVSKLWARSQLWREWKLPRIIISFLYYQMSCKVLREAIPGRLGTESNRWGITEADETPWSKKLYISYMWSNLKLRESENEEGEKWNCMTARNIDCPGADRSNEEQKNLSLTWDFIMLYLRRPEKCAASLSELVWWILN